MNVLAIPGQLILLGMETVRQIQLGLLLLSWQLYRTERDARSSAWMGTQLLGWVPIVTLAM